MSGPQETLKRVMEFGGPGLAKLSMDERATLTNMATECSARTAIVEADERTFEWLAEWRPEADLERLRARVIRGCAIAESRAPRSRTP